MRFVRNLSIFYLLSILATLLASAQFESRLTTPTLQSPSSIAVGDFNRDGKLDIAVAAFLLSDQVSIFLGNGDGTFQPPVNYAANPGPISVVAADLNRDGILDLAVADFAYTNNVSVLLGNGDGTFQPPKTYSVSGVPREVAVGDFNDDKKLDLAILNPPYITILLGNGDGTFEPPVNTRPSYAPGSVGVGDFNGDGKLDVAVGENFAGVSQVEILLGNGDGTFQFGQTYSVGPEPSSVAVGDLRNIGKLDLAVASQFGQGITVLLGNGDGTFQPPVNYLDTGAYWVTAADLNGDHKLDLAIANFDVPPGISTVASVMLGNGDGTFQPPQFYPTGKESNFIAVGDFNGDKLPDLMVTEVVHNDIIELLNTGVVAFSPTRTLYFNQAAGSTSAPQDVMLTNTGSTRLRIASMRTSREFGVGTTCKKTVAAGAKCTISVTFSPRKQGVLRGTLTILDSASSKPQVIELVGTGT